MYRALNVITVLALVFSSLSVSAATTYSVVRDAFNKATPVDVKELRGHQLWGGKCVLQRWPNDLDWGGLFILDFADPVMGGGKYVELGDSSKDWQALSYLESRQILRAMIAAFPKGSYSSLANTPTGAYSVFRRTNWNVPMYEMYEERHYLLRKATDANGADYFLMYFLCKNCKDLYNDGRYCYFSTRLQ